MRSKGRAGRIASAHRRGAGKSRLGAVRREHARDGTGGEYANNVPGQFRLQITNETVRRHVLRAYKVDEVCLDYEEEGEQETWRLEVERRRPTSVDLQNPGIAPVSLRSSSGAVGSDSEG